MTFAKPVLSVLSLRQSAPRATWYTWSEGKMRLRHQTYTLLTSHLRFPGERVREIVMKMCALPMVGPFLSKVLIFLEFHSKKKAGATWKSSPSPTLYVLAQWLYETDGGKIYAVGASHGAMAFLAMWADCQKSFYRFISLAGYLLPDGSMENLGSTNCIGLLKMNRCTPIMWMQGPESPPIICINCKEWYNEIFSGNRLMCQHYRMEYKPLDSDMVCLHSGAWTHDELIDLMDLPRFEGSPSGSLRSLISTWLFYEPGSVFVSIATEDNKAGLFSIALVDMVQSCCRRMVFWPVTNTGVWSFGLTIGLVPIPVHVFVRRFVPNLAWPLHAARLTLSVGHS